MATMMPRRARKTQSSPILANVWRQMKEMTRRKREVHLPRYVRSSLLRCFSSFFRFFSASRSSAACCLAYSPRLREYRPYIFCFFRSSSSSTEQQQNDSRKKMRVKFKVSLIITKKHDGILFRHESGMQVHWDFHAPQGHPEVTRRDNIHT